MSVAKLVVQRGPIPNQEFELVDDAIHIGRSADNQIIVNDAEVSRRHARIVRQQDEAGEQFMMEDLGSTNGTFVNGLRCTGLTPLSNGDVVELGESVRMVLVWSEAAPAAEDESEFDTADLPPLPAAKPAPAVPPSAAPPQEAPVVAAEDAARPWWSDRRYLIGCGCAGLLLICLCGGALIFLDSYQQGRLLYCGGLRPLFELVLGPFGFTPVCP